MKSIAVFASGGGTDLQSVIDGVESGRIKNACVKTVVSDKTGVYALERADKHNIAHKSFLKAEYENDSLRYADIIKYLDGLHIDFIVLAGYLGILPAFFVRSFEGRIINIHPSLIPAFCGDGFYGMRVHRAVVAAGEKQSGATVHFVDEGTDTGAVIIQEKVPVLADDTPESLQRRVLECEHRILPLAVDALVNGRVKLIKGKAVWTE